MTLFFVFLIGIIICWLWYPWDTWISSGMPLLDYNEADITLEMNIEYHTKLFFYWICSLPCFVIVIMDFIETFFARKYGKFNIKSAKIIRKMSLILFISSAVFIIGNVIFMLLGWNLSPLSLNSRISTGLMYCIIGVIGVFISAGFYASYKHTVRVIKENNAA